jgi:hypothetical protein
MPDLMPRIVSTSSTVPFSQVAMISRRSSSALTTGDAKDSGGPTADDSMLSGILMSMNVRRQLFLQKLQRVASFRVVR